MTWAWILKGMSSICRVRYWIYPRVELVALLAPSISIQMLALGKAAMLSTRFFLMAMI